MKEVKSNLEWKLWGQRDPLWAVATWEGKQKDGDAPWTDETFYSVGASEWVGIRKQWEKYGLLLDAVVEIGCGAGRMTRQLAQDFGQVLAIDVAPGMIDYAKTRIGSPNVRFELVNSASIPASDSSMTAAFSTHVFQHLDSAQDVADYFREIARVLSAGATAMIHVPVFAWPHGAAEWARRGLRIDKWKEDRRAAQLRKHLQHGEPSGLMRMHSYETEYLFRFLPTIGFTDVEIMIFAIRNDPHSFVMCRRA